MNTRILLLAVLTLAASPAIAQTGAKPAAPAQGEGPDAAFNAWDTDKNGVLSKEEFRAGWAMARNDLVVQRLAAEFQRQDANKNGKIEANEYANLMIVKRLGPSAPPMTQFDRNTDGGLDFDEYLVFVKAGAERLGAPKKP